jgi:hypothetical protein
MNPGPTTAHCQLIYVAARPLYIFSPVQEDEENPDVRDGGD